MPITKSARPASHPSSGVNKRTTRSQTDIKSFARESKPAVSPAESKKRKAAAQDVNDEPETPKLASCKKLRRPQASQRPISETPTDTPTKGARTLLADFDLSTPKKPLKLKSVSDSSSFTIETPPTSPCSSSAPSLKEVKSGDELPQEIRDLITLHSSFLSALSLHYAHNGATSPVDLRTLTPSVTKVWGKRRVTIDDIKRTLGVMQSSLLTDRPASALKQRTYHLLDYGRGRICLEQQESKKARAKRTNSIIPQAIDEKSLNALFEREIHTRWVEYRCKITPNSKSPSSLSYFISQLPLAEVTESPSLAKMAPLLAKGQKRLEDFRSGAINSRTASSCFHTSAEPVDAGLENARPASVKALSTKASKASFAGHKKSVSSLTSTTTSSTVSDDAKSTSSDSSKTPLIPASATAPSRATSLLDRILAKQAAAAAAPAGPTPEARARQAALQRCEDVLATLSLLATTAGSSTISSRVSFPLPRLMQDIQTSSRSPIGADEIKRVVEVLAWDIVPGYIGLVKMGTLEAVVVDRSQAVGGVEVRKRLVAAGAEGL
ncbi:hypothetical protein B0J12DRAFT_658739 [Macrophomina phaseolina]|uniref:DNA replication factor Cdt1 C-terminal domain-containing protein n=1 Tax=Macrophomina phaseolina TaxID=35725 RepID=A0ABQ8GDU7_9PEZI|nr:hypothetical protein B0J12DRAFT_658739 [Macrophomina phaseolina]